MSNVIERGHVIVTGQTSNWQGLIAAELARGQMAKGTTLVQLIDHESERGAVQQHQALWLRYRGIPPDRVRYRVVVGHPYHDEADLLLAVDDELSDGDRKAGLLIFRDMATHSLPLLPGASWLRIGKEVAAILDCPVLTASHYGSHAALKPKASDFTTATAVWEAMPDFPANIFEPVNGFGAKLVRAKPSPAEIRFKADQRSGLILWNEHSKERAFS